MSPKRFVPVVAMLVLLAIPPSSAQSGAWHGQDNEFGSIRTHYSIVIDGERAPIEAKVVLRRNYEEKESRFFMFAWDVRNTALDVEFGQLIRTDTGQEMPCYQFQGTSTDQLKCFVDSKDMPAAGTEIVMRGTIGASHVGNFNAGAIVLPFNYKWEKISMSNGLDAELYGYTGANVHAATTGNRQLRGLGNSVPAPGIAFALVAIAGVALLVSRRRE